MESDPWHESCRVSCTVKYNYTRDNDKKGTAGFWCPLPVSPHWRTGEKLSSKVTGTAFVWSCGDFPLLWSRFGRSSASQAVLVPGHSVPEWLFPDISIITTNFRKCLSLSLRFSKESSCIVLTEECLLFSQGLLLNAYLPAIYHHGTGFFSSMTVAFCLSLNIPVWNLWVAPKKNPQER